MTEENKENCNFQQTYNVFGLDDKPCCYLYHKYCEEINNCYFKRCKRLEQENKELQAYKDVNEDFKKAWDELNEKYKQLRSALETIQRMILSAWEQGKYLDGGLYNDLTNEFAKINEVLQ